MTSVNTLLKVILREVRNPHVSSWDIWGRKA